MELMKKHVDLDRLELGVLDVLHEMRGFIRQL